MGGEGGVVCVVGLGGGVSVVAGGGCLYWFCGCWVCVLCGGGRLVV